MNIYDRLESEVRSYCRAFPAVFSKAQGCYLFDESGNRFIDFFVGAGTLNYGHNDPQIKRRVIDYLEKDGVLHGLDMWTVAKGEFLETFENFILRPRGLDYKIQFTSPTGTNAVEAALKLARKVKARSNIISFTNGFHGMSAGALAATGNQHFRNEAFVHRLDVTFMPFDGYFGEDVDTLAYLRRFLADKSSGIDHPAAVIVETVQAEGGVNVARMEWLQGLEQICREFDMLMIIDDIQVGNGRTGSFFSFEDAGIRPDLVTLSKAIGGIGFPMSLLLIRPEIDLWKPAEHTGTFRGNNLAFVASKAALDIFWANDDFTAQIRKKEQLLRSFLTELQRRHSDLGMNVRGRGLIYGLEIPQPEMAKAISREAFRRRLIIELAGSEDQVLKFLPPLVVEDDILLKGLEIIGKSLEAVLAGDRA